MILKKLSAVVMSVALIVFFASAIMSDNGRAGRTGSPGEATCTDCHADYNENDGVGSISISGITGGTYTPGTTYNMSITVSRSGSTVFGLGCEVLTASNTNAGTLVITNSAQTQLKSATVSSVSRQSVVHQLDGGFTSNSHTFNFNWTAPAAGTGPVTFYYSSIAGNHDGNESGDYVYTSSMALTESGGCATPAQPGAISGTTAVCAGSTQTYSVAAVATATDYIWTLPSGWSGTSTTNSITVTAGSAGGTITVAAHNACGASTAQPLALTVNPAVTPTVSISANPGNTICAGTNVTFTASPTNGGTTPSYQWKLNGSNVGTNSATYSNAALVNGDVVTCVLTSNAACANATATSNSVTMTITSGLTPTVSVSANPGSTICAGTNVTFTATGTNGGTTPSYQWKLNGANVGTNSATYSNASLVGGDAVSCVMTSNASCLTTSTATSNTVTMTITTGVTPTVSIGASASTICSGTSVTFTASPVNGGTTPSYQWIVNGSNVGTNSNTYSSSSLANGDAVSCVMTSNAGCLTTTTATSNTVTMTVNASVTATVSITANPGSSICSGTSVTFDAIATNGGSTPSYQWQVNGVNAGTNSPSFTSTTLANNDLVTCVLTSNASCVTSANVTSNSITMSVSTNSTPTVSISADPGETVCTGTNVTFTATPGNGGSAPSYVWTVNGSTVGSNSDTYSSNSLVTGDLVQCTMTSNSTCASSSTAISQVITMTVNNSFIPAISEGGSTTFCDGGNVVLTASSGSSYLWIPGGETSQSITVTTSGSYSVEVTSGACSGTSSASTVTVNPLPVVTLAAFNAVCSTDAAFVLTGGSPSGGDYSGNGVSAGSFDPAVAGVGSAVFTYSYTDGLGCSSSANSTIQVNNCSGGGCTTAPDMPGHIHGPWAVVCGQTGVVYSVALDTAASSYTWTVPTDAVITANNGNSITVDFGANFTNGTICVTATNACGTSPARCMFVHRGKMHVSHIDGSNMICPDTLVRDYSIQPVNGAVTYTWSATGGAVVTANGNSATIDFTGVTSQFVMISVQVEDACGHTRTRFMWVRMTNDCTSDDHHDDDDDGDDDDGEHGHGDRLAVSSGVSYSVYPNPTTGQFTIDLGVNTASVAKITIMDLVGKTQKVITNSVTRGTNNITIDASELNRGIYILKIEMDGMPTCVSRLTIQE
ncbi:MAG: T9SS type A sorting domain-containing protein [Bacteroidetes bacterium]|nr:T9SS type A sorting domain-containing protein [Bacteroidota bacterium]